jgi:hypothetical protein
VWLVVAPTANHRLAPAVTSRLSKGQYAPPSPFQLDLELALIGLHLELDLELKPIGDANSEMHSAVVELQVIVTSEHVGEEP